MGDGVDALRDPHAVRGRHTWSVQGLELVGVPTSEQLASGVANCTLCCGQPGTDEPRHR
eukprot:CAMPEP_0175884580 /NCGR_PEP_ID=MMETSP0107_2-20121207/44601_1 /TAXON_ID=195067 ORGANISM="Goniomonas pacifica, Strain CCMP1869" /NCGR_SAMPLE_ID=MMETSP0107_2 /ASSEMBLY_ACC=CAM_ASM_000203 /LENGTH=58 /DNA_ID=CAMNT_0017204749 /DNA_START=34 /DNA_END=207 /DNA_ORIENTATION=-